MTYGPDIIRLRQQGMTYEQICDTLGCSTGTVCYYLKPGQKETILANKRKLVNRPLHWKLNNFTKKDEQKPQKSQSTRSLQQRLNDRIWQFSRENDMYKKANITVADLLAKFGDNPCCYLTGRPINLNLSRSYEFDHIVPKSRGGDNSIDNLGLASKDANQAKRSMTVDEFINLCKSVLEHNGFQVIKS